MNKWKFNLVIMVSCFLALYGISSCSDDDNDNNTDNTQEVKDADSLILLLEKRYMKRFILNRN